MKKLILFLCLIMLNGCGQAQTIQKDDFDEEDLINVFIQNNHTVDEIDSYMFMNEGFEAKGIVMNTDQQFTVYLLSEKDIVYSYTLEGSYELLKDTLHYISDGSVDASNYYDTIKYQYLECCYLQNQKLYKLIIDLENYTAESYLIGNPGKINSSYIQNLFISNHKEALIKDIITFDPVNGYYGAILYEAGNQIVVAIANEYDFEEISPDRYSKYIEGSKLKLEGTTLKFNFILRDIEQTGLIDLTDPNLNMDYEG